MSLTIEKVGKRQVISGLQMEDGTPVNVIVNASGLVEVAKWTLVNLSGSTTPTVNQRQNNKAEYPNTGKEWTQEENSKIGTATDKEIAKVLQRTPSSVTQQRLKLKIQPFKKNVAPPAATAPASESKKTAPTKRKRTAKKKAAAK